MGRLCLFDFPLPRLGVPSRARIRSSVSRSESARSGRPATSDHVAGRYCRRSGGTPASAALARLCHAKSAAQGVATTKAERAEWADVTCPLEVTDLDTRARVKVRLADGYHLDGKVRNDPASGARTVRVWSAASGHPEAAGPNPTPPRGLCREHIELYGNCWEAAWPLGGVGLGPAASQQFPFSSHIILLIWC